MDYLLKCQQSRAMLVKMVSDKRHWEGTLEKRVHDKWQQSVSRYPEITLGNQLIKRAFEVLNDELKKLRHRRMVKLLLKSRNTSRQSMVDSQISILRLLVKLTCSTFSECKRLASSMSVLSVVASRILLIKSLVWLWPINCSRSRLGNMRMLAVRICYEIRGRTMDWNTGQKLTGDWHLWHMNFTSMVKNVCFLCYQAQSLKAIVFL